MDFFSGDFHFDHGNILKYCNRLDFMTDAERNIVLGDDERAKNDLKIGWSSVKLMNDTLLDNINEMVARKDRLFVLGDFCWFRRSDPLGSYRRFRNKINCKHVHLLFGNHDPKFGSKARHSISDLFETVSEVRTLKIENVTIFLSHYAHAIWDMKHHGSYHFFAHSHGNADGWLDEIMPDRKSLDVGVDNAYKLLGDYRPFSLTKAISIINGSV